MQRVAQPVLDVPRLFAPMDRVFKPVFPIGDIGPGADLADAVGKRVDIAHRVVAEAHLFGDPVGRHRAMPAEVGIDAGDDLAMLRRRDVAIVGQRAALPEQLHILPSDREVARFIARQKLQRLLIGCDGHAGEGSIVGRDFEAPAQRFERSEIELGVAPLHLPHGLEVVAFELDHELGLERRGIAGDAERAVVHVAPGAAGDLAELGRGERPRLVAVELGIVGEGDVVHVEIEPHADGVSRDEEVDVAILVHVDLGIAGAG